MAQGARLILFVAFVVLALWARRPGAARRRTSLLILYVLIASMLVGVAQKDAWPFSAYPMLAEDATASDALARVVLRGVDASGREWEIDAMAWSPLPSLKIAEWVEKVYPRLTPFEQRSAERFLWERAEAARLDTLLGARLGHSRLLGPLAAPPWMQQRLVAPAPAPFVALRAYEMRWRARELLLDPTRVERRLVFDTRRP
jgi:hypothetical protein